MEKEIVSLLDEIKNKNRIIHNFGSFNKPQNLSYKESNKTFSSSEKVLIFHDNDTTMETQNKRSNRSSKFELSKRDNSKRSQDNGIVIDHLVNSTTPESVELKSISKIKNNLEKSSVNKDNIVILGDSTVKHEDDWKLLRLLKSNNKKAKVMHFSGATTECMIDSTLVPGKRYMLYHEVQF